VGMNRGGGNRDIEYSTVLSSFLLVSRSPLLLLKGEFLQLSAPCIKNGRNTPAQSILAFINPLRQSHVINICSEFDFQSHSASIQYDRWVQRRVCQQQLIYGPCRYQWGSRQWYIKRILSRLATEFICEAPRTSQTFR
jgi:hypothetical protein